MCHRLILYLANGSTKFFRWIQLLDKRAGIQPLMRLWSDSHSLLSDKVLVFRKYELGRPSLLYCFLVFPPVWSATTIVKVSEMQKKIVTLVYYNTSLFTKRTYRYDLDHTLYFLAHWAQSAQAELLWSVFVRRPSSSVVRRPSSVVRRPSCVVRKLFLLKHLLLWNRSLDFDQTSQEWSLGGPLPKLLILFQLVAWVGHGVKK